MSAAWVKLATVLCLCCSGLGDPESTEVLWRGCGEAVTIQCRSSESHLKHLELKKGLYKHVSVLQKSENQSEIGQGFTGRVQEHGDVPNIDVLIRNLSSDDTGPYWCIYRQSKEKEGKQGNGSVLVVVKGDQCPSAPCNTSDKNLVLVSVIICTTALLTIIMCVLMWLIKTMHQTKPTTYAAVKPRPDPNNCIYEEMSGTLRCPPAT